MVVPSICILRRFFLAASMPLRMADGTSLALPTPNPTTLAPGAHRSAGDHAGPFRSRLQQHQAAAESAQRLVRNGGPQYMYLAQILLGRFDAFANGRRHFAKA